MSNILWMCLEVVANISESFLCIHYIINSFDNKCKLVNSRVAHVIGVIVLAAIITILNHVTLYEGLWGLFYVAFYISFSMLFLYGSFLKKIFIAIITNTVMISTAALASNVFFAIFKDDTVRIYTEHTVERFLFMVTGIALFAYALALMGRFTCGKKEALRTKEWILILSVLIISTLIIAAIQIIILNDKNNAYINWLIISEIGLIIINILCLYITSNLNETHKREENLLLEKKRNEYNHRYAQSIREQYEQTRRLRHDMKQYVASLSALINEKKYDAAAELLDKQTLNLSKAETVIDVENDFINAILNSKLTYAKSKNIDVICSVDRNISSIDDMDLCNLLGNILDNAITASEMCDLDSRLIEVEISSVGSRVIILVKNSIPCSVLNDNPNLKSTKSDPEEHGFGVKTIKSIVEKYNGKTDFYEEGLTFICLAELYKEHVNLT